jgi:predicted ATPase
MRVTKFRVENFRSIADSSWIPLSEDGISTIVGMNESGKSSVLEALACTLGAQTITARDIRFGCPDPEIHLEYLLTKIELSEICEKFPQPQNKLINEFFNNKHLSYRARFFWEKKENEFIGFVDRNLSELYEKLNQLPEAAKTDSSQVVESSPSEQLNDPAHTPALPVENTPNFEAELDIAINTIEPVFVLFSDDSGVLPDSIDVSDYKLKGIGAIGARNFLIVADIDLKKLVDGSDIERVNLLRRATKKITRDFGEFWSQNIGEAKKLELECEIQSKRTSSGDQAGAPYLTFWITDGVNRLHPSQRSKGLRWFLSFYLQLRASEVTKKKRLFLLDEPGANLHETAQTDVLRLINKISPSLDGLIYTTHSPHLVEPNQLHRILTVERATDSDESPSIIRSILKEASSCSGETLSPIYTRMGVDFWRQTVIQRKNNVLLEEPSGFFYLRAFWLLTKKSTSVSFIPCTGVNNIPQLAYMFSGWGLGFCVAVDDEPSGRGVYKELKDALFGGDDDAAKKRLYKFKDCAGIEDIFSISDFQKIVIHQIPENYPSTNSLYLKKNGGSKPLLACRFFLAVEKNEIQLSSFEQGTQEKILETVQAIENMLN